jgi:hypothetical protein
MGLPGLRSLARLPFLRRCRGLVSLRARGILAFSPRPELRKSDSSSLALAFPRRGIGLARLLLRGIHLGTQECGCPVQQVLKVIS